jgi:hypothetical protein
MPIDATPLEQVVVDADAEKEAFRATVAPLLGLATITVANAGDIGPKVNIKTVRNLFKYCLPGA